MGFQPLDVPGLGPAAPHPGWESWTLVFAALHLIAGASFLAVAVAWSRHERRRALLISGFAAVAVVALTFLAAVQPSDIPIDWVTILHHSLGRKTIMHVYARGVHAGPNFEFVIRSIAAGPVPNLHDVVRLNLLLGIVNAVIFFHLALRVTRPVWALAWTLVFALNPATFYACFSELPTNLLALYFLLGAVGWAVLVDPCPQSRAIRTTAYLLCGVLTLLTGLIRPEVAAIGVVALLVEAGTVLAPAEFWAGAGRRLGAIGERCLAYLGDHLGAVAALCVLGWLLAKTGIPELIGRSEVSGIYPFNPSFLSLFVFLPMVLLPIGVSVAVLFGFARAIVEFRRFGGLALSLFVLVRAYFAAQYEYFEMGRYLSYVLPAVFLLGLFGKQAFDDLVRGWRPSWRRAAQIVYLMSWFTLPLPGIPEFYARPEYHWKDGFAQVLLDRNTQQEVRYLMTLVENHPQCVFVGRVVEEYGRNPKVSTAYHYLLFGAPLSQPIQVPESGTVLDEVIARYAPGASCVRLYYGGDCNLTFADRCRNFIAGRRLVDEHRFWSRPYNNPLESGYGAPEIVLATYAWP